MRGISRCDSIQILKMYPLATSYFPRGFASSSIANFFQNLDYCQRHTTGSRKQTHELTQMRAFHFQDHTFNEIMLRAKSFVSVHQKFLANKRQCARSYRSTASRVESAKSSDVIAAEETESPGNSKLLDDETTALPDSLPVAPRSRKLASIIRDGVVLLNQTAAKIQSNTQTSKSMFISPDEKYEPDAKQLAEEHRIFETAQQCLEDLCTKDPTFPLMAGEEPILLLGVKVKPSFTHADIYWSLPYCVLSARELNDKQRDFLNDKMSERINGSPGKVLLHRINAVLCDYYPPKMRFKAAPPFLVHQLLHDLEEE